MNRLFFPCIAALIAGLGASVPAHAQLKKAEEKPTPAFERISQSADAIEKYLYLVDHLARISENSTSSGIAAVLSAHDLLADKPQDAIEYFTRALPEVKNESVKRAIRLELSDLYKRTGQPDKALEQLRELMIAASPTPSQPKPSAR